MAAGVTSGNIYRYYKNKEQLFDAIVLPVHNQYIDSLEEIRRKVQLSYARGATSAPDFFSRIERAFIELFKTYSSEFTILLNRSEGTKYEGVKPELEDLVSSLLERVLAKPVGDEVSPSAENRAVAGMLASTIVEGICVIFRDNEEGETLKFLIDQYLSVYSKGIAGLIHSDKENRSGCCENNH
jgi:AcrR family transcriptional regulator